MYLQHSNHLLRAYIMSLKITIRRVRSDNDSEFKNTKIDELCDSLELDINSRTSTLHNQMVLLRERIEHSLIWQGLYLVSTM